MHPALNSRPLLRALAALKQSALDILFPLTCLGCNQAETLLCPTCLATILLAQEQHCPLCHRHITPHGETCFACSSKSALDGVFVSYDYHQTLLDTALHTFKYRSIEALAWPLGTLLVHAVRLADIPLPDLILPIPLHPWRLRYRGFNQSELLAQHLANSLLPGMTLPLETTRLIRKRFTLPQQKMKSADARRRNIHHAFSVPATHRAQLKGKYIWLIDDVAATASTLESAAQALKKAGVKKVFGIVLARGISPSNKK